MAACQDNRIGGAVGGFKVFMSSAIGMLGVE